MLNTHHSKSMQMNNTFIIIRCKHVYIDIITHVLCSDGCHDRVVNFGFWWISSKPKFDRSSLFSYTVRTPPAPPHTALLCCMVLYLYPLQTHSSVVVAAQPSANFTGPSRTLGRTPHYAYHQSCLMSCKRPSMATKEEARSFAIHQMLICRLPQSINSILLWTAIGKTSSFYNEGLLSILPTILMSFIFMFWQYVLFIIFLHSKINGDTRQSATPSTLPLAMLFNLVRGSSLSDRLGFLFDGNFLGDIIFLLPDCC